MKKSAVFVFACICIAAMLTGCGNKDAAAEQRADHIPPVSDIPAEDPKAESFAPPSVSGIKVTTEYPVYAPDTAAIRLHIVNENDESFYLPQTFSLSQFVEMESGYDFQQIPYSDNGDSFTDLAMEVPEHGEADITLDLAAHYDLPLDTGHGSQYRVQIGEIGADFVVDTGFEPNEEDTAPASDIIMDMEQESYPAGTAEITVRLINAGAADYTFRNGDFGIEQFTEGAVSMTRFSADSEAAQNGMTLQSEDCIMWTLNIADFPGSELQPGEYAVSLNGYEAHFMVTD